MVGKNVVQVGVAEVSSQEEGEVGPPLLLQLALVEDKELQQPLQLQHINCIIAEGTCERLQALGNKWYSLGIDLSQKKQSGGSKLFWFRSGSQFLF